MLKSSGYRNPFMSMREEALQKSFSENLKPPCANPAPVWGGGAYDSSVLPGDPDLGNTALSRLGCPSGGAKPLQRHLEGGFQYNRGKALLIRSWQNPP